MCKTREQVTCNCSAYEFPHRINSGKCSGADWAESYFEYEHSCCSDSGCNCFNADEYVCEVAVGQESVEHCEGFAEHLRAQPDYKHPMNEEEGFTFLCCGATYDAEQDEHERENALGKYEIPF